MTDVRKVVFVSGNFYALHSGHIRLLRFAAECGNYLVVGVNNISPDVAFPPPQDRAEALRALGFVDRAVVLEEGLEAFLNELRPNIVVKGKEFETQDNPEEPILQRFGGKLLFSSGESSYSASELLLRDGARDRLKPPVTSGFAKRYDCGAKQLAGIVERFAQLRVVVVGDLIVDEYIESAALGMSREDPTLVVSPQATRRFIGGAGIVAGHAQAMGAQAHLVTVVGTDELGSYVHTAMGELGVKAKLVQDESRPTTLKQRFRAAGKTLLRVTHLRQHELQRDLRAQFVAEASSLLDDADLLIFSDFNYGALPQTTVDELSRAARDAHVLVAADSQSSSQVGDVSRFKGANLLTPTEHEARLAMRDQSGGVAHVGHSLLNLTQANGAFITLGPEGILIVTRDPQTIDETDRLPAFNTNPVDVAGAGDSMLVSGAMALAAGATIWQAGFIGSIAAGIQTSRVGNVPIKAADILDVLK